MSHSAGGNHPWYFAHHFANLEQQKDAAKLGMWIFLVTEVLTFGGLFCAYAIYRSWHPEMFFQAHHELNRIMGAINTIVLITSSVTIALAIRCMQLNQKKGAIINLVFTLIFAGTFMVIKYFEYSHKFHVGQLPGESYHFAELLKQPGVYNPHLFFGIYFAMTGLHGLHVLIGMGLITWLIIGVVNDRYSPQYYTPIEMVGLFWHLVDLIWIFLFPLFYLIG